MIKVRDLELLSKEQLLELSEAIDDNLESFDASEQKRREFEESLRALKTRAKKSFRVKSLQGQLADLEANRAFGEEEQYKEELDEIYDLIQGKLSRVVQLWNKLWDTINGGRRRWRYVSGYGWKRVVRD